MRVLIADDNGMMREVQRMFLEQARHEVVAEAADGAEAVKFFTEHRPDLVLLDLVMPGTTGLEALEKIRALDPAAKVIMVTAIEQDAMDKKILGLGAAAILRKPFSSEELEAAMQRLP